MSSLLPPAWTSFTRWCDEHEFAHWCAGVVPFPLGQALSTLKVVSGTDVAAASGECGDAC